VTTGRISPGQDPGILVCFDACVRFSMAHHPGVEDRGVYLPWNPQAAAITDAPSRNSVDLFQSAARAHDPFPRSFIAGACGCLLFRWGIGLLGGATFVQFVLLAGLLADCGDSVFPRRICSRCRRAFRRSLLRLSLGGEPDFYIMAEYLTRGRAADRPAALFSRFPIDRGGSM